MLYAGVDVFEDPAMTFVIVPRDIMPQLSEDCRASPEDWRSPVLTSSPPTTVLRLGYPVEYRAVRRI